MHTIMDEIKLQSKLSFGKDVEDKFFHTAGWHVSGTTTLENCLAMFAKEESMFIWKHNSYTSATLMCIFTTGLCSSVHSSIIHNNKN